MRDIPIETLLSFPIPNYENPVLRGPVLLYINSVLLGITLALVLLRVYTRVFLQRWMGADDWLILIAARQRIGVIILLSLGFVVTIAGVTRTFFIWKSLIASYDETWYAYPLWIAAAVEVDLAVICACAPAVRPFLLLCVGPLVTSLSGSRSVRSHKKGDGYTLTRSLPSSRGNLAAEVTFDAKINAIDTVRDDGKTPTVKLSLSKTPIDGKLKIMHRVSWNVDYGDRSEPLNPDDLSVPQNDYDIGIALSTPSEEKRQLKPGGRGSHSVDIVEASRQHSLNLSPSLQSLASNSHFVRTESNRPLSKCGHTPQPQGIDEETFWRSDSESNHGSTTPDRNSEDQDQEQRWNIRRNSFRNEQHGVFLLPQTRSDEGARAMEMKALSWPTRSPMQHLHSPPADRFLEQWIPANRSQFLDADFAMRMLRSTQLSINVQGPRIGRTQESPLTGMKDLFVT
ncbi:hypothetical protein FKW77_001626 [Venturia effusa]|uniref:Rhodopsin domain-containing protein n=1 Tax=Venturia effusa TaxID=50376 RepID=A0A517KZ18_9PEZI|nr:hypothetical protein FKW77_001626 [Venturia effusa]